MVSPRQETDVTRPAESGAAESVHRRAPAHRTTAASHDPTLADFAWTLAERRWTIAAVAGAALALAASYLAVAPPVYEASVLIQVESRARPVAGFQDLAPLFEGETPAEGERRIMRSRPIVEAVIDQLGLDVEARPRTLPIVGRWLVRRHEGSGLAPARFGLGRFAWGGERIRVKRLTVSDALLGERLVLTVLEGGRYRTAASDGTVLVEGELGKPVTGTDGDRSVEMLVTELTARPGTEVVLRKLRRIDVIEQLQKDLEISDEGRRTGLVEVTLTGEDPAQIARILDAVSASYMRQSVERTSLEAAKTLQILEAQLPVVKSNLEKAERALNAFRQKKGTVNLSLEAGAMFARITEIDRSIAENELRTAELHRLTALHPEIPTLAQRTERLREQRAAMEARMRTLPDLELESTRLTRQVRVSTDMYMLILSRAEELRIVKSGWIGNARVLEHAVEPHRPVRPKRAIVMALAAILGLALGVTAALARNALDDSVRDADEIEAGTGLPVFATIPRSRAQRRLARRSGRGPLHALSVVDPTDAAVEDLRSLRTGVEFALLRATNNVVAVGSPGPRAGKSFVSVNLAHLLAASNGRVLLVDGDLRRGILHRYFALEAEPGLSDALTGEATLDAAIHPTESHQLDVLPAGRHATNPADLLASARFPQLLEEVGRRYKVVVIDTPPILSVTDSALVGRHAGVNLLVLRAGEHSTREIAHAVKRLVQNGVTVRGAILNDVRPSAGRYGRPNRYRRYDARPA
jgi:tyrosine-protein kinase Etk/Wzc